MSNRNNLQNALKKAFSEHEEPLREAQWDRIEGTLHRLKPKNKFLPFIYPVLLISLTSVTTYFLTLNYGPIKKDTGIKKPVQVSHLNSGKKVSTFDAKEFLNSFQKPLQPETKRKHLVLNHSVGKPEMSKPAAPEILSVSVDENTVASDKEEEITEVTSGEDKQSPVSPVLSNTSSEAEEILKKDKSDPGKNQTDDPKEMYTPVPPVSRLAFTLSSGLSRMNLKDAGTNQQDQMHKDTRMLFQKLNQNPRAVSFNLGMEYTPAKHLGISTGLQYMRISNQVDVDYQYRESPFYDGDKIIGYIQLSDNETRNLTAKTTNTTTFLYVPFRLNYTLPVDLKNELMISGGINFSSIITAKGEAFAVNEGELQPLNKNRYNSFSTGFSGALQYSRMLNDPWWFGLEGQWLSNKLDYNTGHGILRNQLSGYRLNFVLKYKLKKT